MWLRRGLWISTIAAVVILALLPSVSYLGLRHPANLAGMYLLTALAAGALYSFSKALGERLFLLLGLLVVPTAAAGVALLSAGWEAGGYLIAAAYWGEPVMGYFIYRRLAGRWRGVFLASAAAYAYSLPLTLFGLWLVPAVADAVKLAALVNLLREPVRL
ncbi:hypothetical protein [Pyrobaculum neutrophilum]|uniref:Uncharacterized protein n=1 Tax=Pyrobaculum neutrophilum (strain DSM 2338 / JCM 9278 / NBRC 100436 / V24Sta) TaxID=444157 RepID=B1YBV0_PYRNV|nr:hypothetical protein [Pyrobaculum neutrophilum]ACB39334.1 conserved hypothetical protein [Pyrobaculum neutrophilum V24Sta]